MNIPSITNDLASATIAKSASEAPPFEIRRAAVERNATAPVHIEQSVTEVKKPEETRKELEDAVKAVNDFLQPLNNSLQFNLDDATGKTVVKVIDTETKEIIKQIPSEEMLTIAQAIEKMQGVLVRQTA